MEREVSRENADNMFDFRKNVAHVDEQIKKVETTAYKKLAFVSIAFAVFLSAGITIGNVVHTKYKLSAEAEQAQTLLMIKQQQQDNQKSLDAQKLVQEQKNIDAQKEIDFLSNKIKSIDKATFSKFMNYLDEHKNFYDERVKNIRKSLFEAQSADRAHAIDPNSTSKDLEVSVVNYKKDLEEVMNKTASIYSSVKDGRVKEDKLSPADMKTFLKLYDQFTNGLVLHNKGIELKIKDILYIKNKANVDYNNSHDMFGADEKINQTSENTIKKLKP